MDEVIVDATTPTTLVFFHGASFCKEVWQPVIDVLRRYLPRDVEFRTFDMPYHGSAHDEHAVSEARVDPTNATSPRVHHPRINNWVELATEAVQHHAASLMEEMSFTRQRRRLIGIGHSLGATGLWTTEMRRPAYAKGAVVSKTVSGQTRFELACHPHLEAAFYTGLPPKYTVEELKRPLCPIRFCTGDKSRMMHNQQYEPLVQLAPHVNSVGTPLIGTTHLMVLEDPAQAADVIARELDGSFSIIQKQTGDQYPKLQDEDIEVLRTYHEATMWSHRAKTVAMLRRSVASMHTASRDAKATLLFCHGGSLCKEVWEPIMDHLRQSPLLQRYPVDMVAFDFPLHGTKRDTSVTPVLHLENPRSPRVTHTGNSWTRFCAEEVTRQVQKLRHDKRYAGKPVIGIGQSMGGCGLWRTEMDMPGTFEGLVLFEPIIHSEHPEAESRVDFLVSITLQREHQWDSWDSVKQYFAQARNYNSWHPASMASYLKGAVIPDPDSPDPANPRFILACHPHIEASLYAGVPLKVMPEQVAQVKCPITFQYGSRTKLFMTDVMEPLLAPHPDIYKIARPMENTSHMMIMEDPVLTAERILEELATLSPFSLLPGVYSRAFQREVFDAIIAGASYNISSLSELQLVAPAVDCNNTSIVTGDSTAIRFQFLARKRQSVTEVMLLTLSISNQQYTIPSQKERGSAGVATLTIIDDLRSNVVDHHFLVSIGYPFEPLNFRVYDFVNVTTDGFWTLQRIPEDSDSDLPKLLQTSCRTGFYIKSDTEQVNVKNEVWELSQSPIDAVTTWQWRGIPVLRDSWAWSHVFQFFQALDAISNLFVLILVFYRNIKVGRVWVGDAFVAVSTRIQFRGLMVLASWYINEFWALMELCYHDANAMSAFDDTFIQSDIIRADVLAIFLSGAGWLGVMTKDRIDPGIAVLVFHIGFENRLTIINWFPSVQAVMVAEAAKLNSASILSFSMDDRASPMHLWGIHPLGERSIKLILAVLTPMLFIFTFIIVYVIARKIYRRLVPEHVHQVHRMTGVSEDEEVLLARQSVLTLFELATGAALQNRFGLVSDYENCLYIKGQKYASADGIYSNGFIIANKKYLVQLDDVRALLLMKVLQVRYRNVYAFEVEGNAVHQTARLMYPNTMTLHDLVHLNISILS
ncbi:TPA: hypothetical protein N0F65_001404 [Lagenidium giganteum]|uniref:AB hydrolase-1 domain-containing protein n=1 Tax=Lagenidium giganteum TaxID=4803 RepID=A0AAV2Z267_9STRA|nr:TPA: hypothetical protein N0F65_001404 [Lagenidium giganteum]